MLCIPKDVNVEKMETSVNLLGLGLAAAGGRGREPAISVAEGCPQPGQHVYLQLVEHATGKDNPDEFHASKGWFEKFRNYRRLRNSSLMEDPLNTYSPPTYSKQL